MNKAVVVQTSLGMAVFLEAEDGSPLSGRICVQKSYNLWDCFERTENVSYSQNEFVLNRVIYTRVGSIAMSEDVSVAERWLRGENIGSLLLPSALEPS